MISGKTEISLKIPTHLNRTKENGEQGVLVRLKNGRKIISANSLAFSPNNSNIFALGGADSQIRLFDIVRSLSDPFYLRL